MLGASSGEARVEGGSSCPVLSTPCQRFALLPGSALQTPGQPVHARDVHAVPSAPVILTAACHLFHVATQHLKEQNCG